MKFQIFFTILIQIILLSSVSSHLTESYGLSGITIELDRNVYAWGDKMHIIIISPSYNEDPRTADFIGDVIGEKVEISTSISQLSHYWLVETGVNTGIFVGEVTITGFSNQDADKDSKVDASGITKGKGPYDGFIESSYGDEIYVSVQEGSEFMVGTSALVRNPVEIIIAEGSSIPQKGGYEQYYQPSSKEILSYSTVVWINMDSTGHTVTSGTPIDGPDGLFDSGIFTAKEEFLYTFDKEGIYTYFCQIHPWMDGEIRVIGSKQPQPTKDEPIEIPTWVKNNAKWWSENQIGDSDFVKGIEYLIKQEIIKVPKTNADTTIPESQKIPSWIKNNAGWWASNQIADSDFVKGIEYLIKSGIIKV